MRQRFLLNSLLKSRFSVSVFPYRTNLKTHNIPVTPKIVKNAITDLDSSKASGPYRIRVVVLKNGEPEISHISTDILNLFLRKFCFPDC